jgi:GMP synthase-like glutamine amidotransferase
MPSNLKDLKGLILPGSNRCALDDCEWLKPVRDLVKKIHDENLDIKVYGGCFGEQFVAHYLGGEARLMPSINADNISYL